MSSVITPSGAQTPTAMSPAERRRAHHVADQIHRAQQQPWLPITTDGVFSFGVFTSLLFILQFGTAGAAGFVLLTAGYVLIRREAALGILLPRAFLLALPALAVLSTFWSVAPKESLKYGSELLFTAIAAILIAGAPNQRSVVQGAFLAFGIYTVISLMFGGYVAMGAHGDTAFSGLNGGKNLVADIVSAGLLLSFGVLLMSDRKHILLWGPLALVAGALHGYVLLEARSAGAMVAAALGIGAFAVLAALQACSTGVRSVLTGLLIVGMVAFALFYREIAALMITIAADVFDKDPSLTGRTYLWARAWDLIVERPVLGVGFDAFWMEGNTEAEGLWRYAGTRSGFNFHSTMVEILIHLGWTGLVLGVLTGVAGVVGLFYRFIARPTPELALWCAMLLFYGVRMPIESLAINEFQHSSLLIFIALGAAVRPWRGPTVTQTSAPIISPALAATILKRNQGRRAAL